MSTARKKKSLRYYLRRYRRIIGLGLILVSTIIILSIIISACSHSEDKNNETTPKIETTTEIPIDITTKVTEEPTTTVKPVETSVIATERKYINIPHSDVLTEDWQDYVYNLCEEYEVPVALVYGLIECESSFRSTVVSSTNDYGLMQINKINHETLQKTLGVTNFLDPYENVLCGVYILSKELKSTNGDVVKALMRYNNGATGAKRLWDKGIYSTAYTDKIMAAYQKYQLIMEDNNG